MVFIVIGVLIFVVGGLAYTLDISVIWAFLIFIGLVALCGFIGYRISQKITSDPEKTMDKALKLNGLTLPSIILGVVLAVIGFGTVNESKQVIATSQKHLLFETIVTPTSLTLIGTFAIMLGITFWLVASPHLPQKPDDKE